MTTDAVLDALMSSIADEDESPYYNMCLFGPPGVGKTVFAATAPKPLFFQVEQGFESLYNHPELVKEARRMRYQGAKQAELLAQKMIEGHFGEYETLVIDTISGLQDRTLKEWTVAAHKKNPGQRDDPFTPEGKDYQRNTEFLKHIIQQLCAVEKHVLFLAHQTQDKDEATGRMGPIRPALTGKAAAKLEREVGILGHMTATMTEGGKVTRRIQLQPTKQVWAKNRIGGMPNAIEGENLTYDMFLNPQNYDWSVSNG